MLADALRTVEADPSAAEACFAIESPHWEADCLTAAAERIALEDAAAAEAWCLRIAEGSLRDECRFQVAEKSREADRCATSGQYADRCRSHLWRDVILERFPPGSDPGAIADAAEAAMVATDIPVKAPSSWAQLWEKVLDGPGPIDRSTCERVRREVARRACLDTALAVYAARLDALVKAGTFGCRELPPAAHPGADPALLDILASRRRPFGCP